MKEIEAISKLSHKNIVGYKGCWVEGGDPDTDTIERIMAKQFKRKLRTYGKALDVSINDGIKEDSDDDSLRAQDIQLNRELNEQEIEKRNEILSEDSSSS